MKNTILSAAAIAAIVVASSLPASASTYKEWSTDYPFSGFHGYSKHSSYCDYIKYPKRHCFYTKYGKRICKIVGWDIRQSCY